MLFVSGCRGALGASAVLRLTASSRRGLLVSAGKRADLDPLLPVLQWPSPAHHGISMSPSVNSISSFATTPSLAASTSSAMSHSSSADTLSTRPSSHFSPHSTAASPGVYCVVPPSPASSGYFGEPSSHGLGLDFAAPSLASLPEEAHGVDAKGKNRVPSAMVVDEAGGVSPEPRKRQTTRPVDVSRRGEDIGLSLGDFDILDTLGCVHMS